MTCVSQLSGEQRRPRFCVRDHFVQSSSFESWLLPDLCQQLCVEMIISQRGQIVLDESGSDGGQRIRVNRQ